MIHPANPSVLICGAGPAGLTLAVCLARHGVPFRIVDKRPGPFVGSRGKGIQPRTLEIFEDLGVLDRILDAGGAYPAQCVHSAEGDRIENGISAVSPTPTEPFGQPWMVMQSLTEGILRECLGTFGVSVEWSTAVTGVTQGDAVSTQLTSPAGVEALASRYVVGADGGRSTLRELSGIPFPGNTLGVRAVVADLELSGLDTRYWHRYNEGDMTRQVSLCPLQGTALVQLQAPLPPDGDVDVTPDGLSRFIAERCGRNDLHVSAVPWASVYVMNARLADRYREGSAFLVGDAAHIHPPTGGQGLNTSIQDAYNLGWKLAAVHAGADERLLDTYEEERRPIAAGMLGLSTRFLDAASKGSMRRGRDAQQLDLAYRESSLNVEVPARTEGLRAGDRAPDAWLWSETGEKVRLFELFRGPHWTRLVVGPDGDGPAWSDLDGIFAGAYRPTAGDCFVIRPDGYIGAILGTGCHDQVDAFGAEVKAYRII